MQARSLASRFSRIWKQSFTLCSLSSWSPLVPALGSPLPRGPCFPIAPRTGGADSDWSQAFLPGSFRVPWEQGTVSLAFIRIKEVSHICKQAQLSQSSPAAVGRGGAVAKDLCGAPCSGRTLFYNCCLAALQGSTIANKWLAGCQKETIWPTRGRIYISECRLDRQRRGSRLQTEVLRSFFGSHPGMNHDYSWTRMQLTSGPWEGVRLPSGRTVSGLVLRGGIGKTVPSLRVALIVFY